MSKKEAPLHQHRRKEVDKNRGGKRKWQNKRGTNSSVWEWRWHGSRCVNVLEIWSIPSRRHHFLFFAEEEEKRWLIPLFFLVARSMGISCYQGIIHLGAEIYIEKRVSYASRVTHRRGFPGWRLHESRLAMIRLWFPAILSVRCPSLLSQIRVGPRPVTAWTDVRVQIPPPCSQASRLPLANHREPALSLDNVHGERVWNIDTCAE